MAEKIWYYAMGCRRCKVATRYHPLTIGDVMVESKYQCNHCMCEMDQYAFETEEKRDKFIEKIRQS